ncbi:hypothetical protein [Cypionkella sp. TWP1-2-1b2]|uniref:ATP dependent DNA ligase n=1 Tax=Cypionkella sp. TWP1-2-1b2 TaxID=2804675 RepID=UPI003CEB8F86
MCSRGWNACANPQARSSSKVRPEQARKVRYVRPDLVAEVEFRGWTADGRLRHASFRGLPEDKPAQQSS